MAESTATILATMESLNGQDLEVYTARVQVELLLEIRDQTAPASKKQANGRKRGK